MGPFVEFGICGVDFHVPVVEGGDVVDLFFDVCHVLGCGLGRVNAHFDGVVLCRQAEGVPAHGMDDVVALHELVAAPDVADDVASPVAYMKSVAGRVGEHIQTIIFWFFSVVDIYRVLFPVLAPFFFYGAVVVRYCHCFYTPLFVFGSKWAWFH